MNAARKASVEYRAAFRKGYLAACRDEYEPTGNGYGYEEDGHAAYATNGYEDGHAAYATMAEMGEDPDASLRSVENAVAYLAEL